MAPSSTQLINPYSMYSLINDLNIDFKRFITVKILDNYTIHDVSINKPYSMYFKYCKP